MMKQKHRDYYQLPTKSPQEGRFPSVQTRYKDTVFRMLFNEKEELLFLFNAVNGTSYDNPEELEVNTLENAIYMSMKNDLSCVLDSQLNLYEHQSTPNPNMPLRNLFYVSRIYETMVASQNIYVEKIREYRKNLLLEEAVERAVTECIEEGILVEFFTKNRAEVIQMSIFEYDQEAHIRMVREEGKAEGKEEGKEVLNQLNLKLLKDNRIEDLRRSVEDKEYQKQLMKEYGII